MKMRLNLEETLIFFKRYSDRDYTRHILIVFNSIGSLLPNSFNSTRMVVTTASSYISQVKWLDPKWSGLGRESVITHFHIHTHPTLYT